MDLWIYGSDLNIWSNIGLVRPLVVEPHPFWHHPNGRTHLQIRNASSEHVVAVLVMWIDHDGQTWMALWDIVECDGDAASQFAMLRVEFIELDWNKCVGGSLDGASVNFGTRNGIVARCTKVNPIVVFVHCSVRETKTLSHTHTHTHT